MGKPLALIVAATNLLHPMRAALEERAFETVERTHVLLRDAWPARRPVVAVVACEGAVPCEGIDTARRIRHSDPLLPVIVVANPGSEALAMAAIKAGVIDYFKMPYDAAAVALSAAQLGEAGPEPSAAPLRSVAAMIGISRAIQQARDHIQRLAATDTSVLVTGDTGTGKELVAQLLHRLSPRAERPMVCINCAAIPDTLLESELFGWERGAFTGATSARAGHFSAASGGTLLLDEVGEMTPYAQTKILRALDRREIYRLGSTQRIPLDVRVVAATNQNLEQLVEEHRFRRDLFYRLHVSRIALTPLRERREDIPLLLSHYIGELNRRFDRHVLGFTATALHDLTAYDWPGNVRQVRNVLESVFAELPPGPVSFLEAPPWLRQGLVPGEAVSHDERTRLLSALAATNWNVSETARQLRWCRMTLYRKIAKYRLARSSHLRDMSA
jgi:DNA-binding NtrC family response regulator